MSYPKPLSEKSIAKLYADSKLTEEKIAFLRKFFDSCAALYGSICLNDMWEVYKELSEKTDVVKIQRNDIYKFSSIARRELHDYYVYEIDEMYIDEKRVEKYRHVIFKEIMDMGWFQLVYELTEKQVGKPFYVPENFLEFKGHIVTPEEKRVFEYIENLKATSPFIRNLWNEKMNKPSPHQGKKLKDFSYLDPSEANEIERLSGKSEDGPKKCQQKKLDEFMASVQGSFAEKIFRELRFSFFSGWFGYMDQIKHTMDSLYEVGVDFTEKEANRFMELIQDFMNNSHLYVNRGWTSSDLSAHRSVMNPNQKPVLTLGPGIKKAIENGDISLEHLMALAKAKGIEIELE